MTTEQFFERFELFAGAPDAIPRLRQLILELAFLGKLSSGDRESWQERAVGSLCASITPGFACSRSHQTPDGHVHLRTHNISTLGTLNFDLLVRIDQKRVDPKKSSLRAGDVLFNNTNSQDLVGKTSLVDRDYDYAFSNHITRLRVNSDTEPGYLVLYLTYLRNSGFFAKLCTRWINQAAINTETLKKQKVPIPSLAEQKRIVAKVDELMALCDQLEAQQQERETKHAALSAASLARFAEAPTPANLNFLFHHSCNISPADLRKTILTLAVQGKIVPQDPNDESAEDWLQRVSKSELSAIQLGETPFSLPKGWMWLRVASVFEVAGGIQKTPHRTPRNNAFPYLGVGNVYRGRLDLTKVKQFELEPGELERRRLNAGDLLIIEGNGSFNEIGRCAKWNGEIENCVHQNHVIRCRPSDTEMCDFVLLFLNSPNGMEIMQRLAITSSGLYSLSVGKIRQIAIPLPPLAEQKRIVAKVDELMALVDQLEEQLASSRTLAAQLTEAVVTELTAAA
jgi:type I restriction enzyme S subunit